MMIKEKWMAIAVEHHFCGVENSPKSIKEIFTQLVESPGDFYELNPELTCWEPFQYFHLDDLADQVEGLAIACQRAENKQ